MAKNTEKSFEVIQVRVTSTERDTLRKAAERLSLATSTYVRMKALEAARDDT